MTADTNGARRRRRMGLLFDLDGTLIRTAFPFNEAKVAVLKKLGELGVDTKDLSPTSTMMEILEEARSRARGSGEISEAKAEEEVGNVLDGFDIASLSKARLQKGAKPVLDSLRKNGFRLGVVTSSGRKGVELVMGRLTLTGYFSAVVTRNDVRSMKPSGEGILKAMEIMRCDGTDTAFVGDSWVDIRAAKDAGVRAIALAGGLSSLERLVQEDPDILVKSLHELPAALGGAKHTKLERHAHA